MQRGYPVFATFSLQSLGKGYSQIARALVLHLPHLKLRFLEGLILDFSHPPPPRLLVPRELFTYGGGWSSPAA